MFFSLFKSEDSAVAEQSQREELEGTGGGGGEEGGTMGEGGKEKGEEEEEEKAMDTPSAPVYCLCRKPDINCFMM